MHAAWHRHRRVERWVIDLARVPHVDVDAAVVLGRLRAEAAEVGVTLEITGGDAAHATAARALRPAAAARGVAREPAA